MINSGNPIDTDYARTHSKWEPLIEMMQIKGSSEVNRSLTGVWATKNTRELFVMR